MSQSVREASAIEGNTLDLDLFARGAGHLRRLGEALGLRRMPRDVTPDLRTYLAQKAAAQTSEPVAGDQS